MPVKTEEDPVDSTTTHMTNGGGKTAGGEGGHRKSKVKCKVGWCIHWTHLHHTYGTARLTLALSHCNPVYFDGLR